VVWDEALSYIDCREDCSCECGSCSCDNRDCVVGDSALEGSKGTRISKRVDVEIRLLSICASSKSYVLKAPALFTDFRVTQYLKGH